MSPSTNDLKSKYLKINIYRSREAYNYKNLHFNIGVYDMTRLLPSDDANKDELAFDAIKNAMAYIEFKPDGTIIEANDKFLDAMGYKLSEVKGKHHRMFVNEEYSKSVEYKEFWKDLANGVPKVGEFLRFNKSGREVYIYASYSPILNSKNVVTSVVKIAIDKTEEKESL